MYPMVACPILEYHKQDPYIGSNDHNFYLFYTSIIKEESEMASKLLRNNLPNIKLDRTPKSVL